MRAFGRVQRIGAQGITAYKRPTSIRATDTAAVSLEADDRGRCRLRAYP